MPIELAPVPFDAFAKLAEFVARQPLPMAEVGANAVFVGTMRSDNDGDTVTAMFMEYYPRMTHDEFCRIEQESKQRWPIHDVFVVHRVGDILPGENIVLVATWSRQRAAAFDACRYIVDEFKHRVPLWKRETLSDGRHRWVSPPPGEVARGQASENCRKSG